MKDILLAILVGYVVIDLACAMVLKRKRPLLFKHMSNVFKKEKRSLVVCVFLGVMAGVGMYFLSTKML